LFVFTETLEIGNVVQILNLIWKDAGFCNIFLCMGSRGKNSELAKEHISTFSVWQMAHTQFLLSFKWSPNCISHSACSSHVARGSNFKISSTATLYPGCQVRFYIKFIGAVNAYPKWTAMKSDIRAGTMCSALANCHT
jgi:hypothetical protein